MQRHTCVAAVAYHLPATPNPFQDAADVARSLPYPVAHVAVASWENDQLVTLAAHQTPAFLQVADAFQVSGTLRATRMDDVWELLPLDPAR